MKPVLFALGNILSGVVGAILVLVALRFHPDWLQKVNKAPSSEVAYDDILKNNDDIQSQFDSLVGKDFFNQKDPFEDLRNMRKQMDKRMELFGGKPYGNPFDAWFTGRFGGGTANDISKREDDKYVYYDIHVSDIKGTSINTKIENDYVVISGTTQKRDSNGEIQSSFNRTFPLPKNVDSAKMEMTSEGDKIVLKFPKTSV